MHVPMHAPQPLPVPSLRLAQSFPPYYTVTLAPRPKLPAILYRHSFHLEVPILGPTLFGLKGATAYDQLGQLRTPMTPDEQRGQGVPMRGGSALRLSSPPVPPRDDSGRAWRLWAARHSQSGEAQPLWAPSHGLRCSS